jgi:ubiquinone/menaquinone biosynthesis C-methylase UbiE
LKKVLKMNTEIAENEYVKKVKRFYEKDAKKYLKDRYGEENITQLGYRIRREIAGEMLNKVNGKILDAGCGPGTFIALMENSDRKIFAFDLSLKMVSEAKREGQENTRHNYLVANLMNLGFREEVFDGVLCIGVLGYIPNPEKALKEIHKVMKRGGEAVVQISNAGSIKEKIYENWIPKIFEKIGIKKKRGWGFDFPLFSYNKKDFDGMIELSGFKIMEWSFYDFHIPFLERISMNCAIRMAKYLQKFSGKIALSFLGSGYLVKIGKI